MAEKLYTVNEVAEILKTNPAFVYRLINAGLLKVLKLGRIKCREASLEEFIRKYDGYDVTDPLDIKELTSVKEESEEGVAANA